MKLLVGLGNPGKQHLFNRHNLGFLSVDAFVSSHGEEFRKEEFRAQTVRLNIAGQDVLVMKPQTFMNRSGDSVGEAMQFFKTPIEDVIVLHDELDIPPMSFRLKRGGGHGGNNGLRSLMHLGDNFVRMRLGIGRPPHPEMNVADYVLGNLSKEELAYWQDNLDKVFDAVELCLVGKVEIAMNQFNRKG